MANFLRVSTLFGQHWGKAVLFSNTSPIMAETGRKEPKHVGDLQHKLYFVVNYSAFITQFDL